jgi:hypothetical protein
MLAAPALARRPLSWRSRKMSAAGYIKRDYSLVGLDTRRAEAEGLATAEWYHTPIPRKRMKELMQRSDERAMRDIIIHAVAMVAAASANTWGTWWAVPAFAAYGVLYTASDSRWHECGHRTAFKTKWMNDVVYEIASFMVIRESTSWRWSHTRHHTDTIIVGRDPEIVPRPPTLWRSRSLPRHHAGRVYFKKIFLTRAASSPPRRTFIPESEGQGRDDGPHPPPDLCHDHRSVARDLEHHAADVYRPVVLRRVALSDDGPHPACRPAEVLDHRLNCRTVHEPGGAFHSIVENSRRAPCSPWCPYYNLRTFTPR